MLVLLVMGLGSMLRPLYAATALVLVEPSTVWDKQAQQVPGNSLIDGEVEIMRSEPVLEQALALIGPIDPTDWGGLLEPNPVVLDFLRINTWTASPEAVDHKQHAAEALAIHRRGLTPIIAVTARAATADLAARLANGIGQAHIALQVRAKSEALVQARALVDAQRAQIAHNGQIAVAGEVRPDMSVERDYDRLSAISAELAQQAELQLPDYRIVAPAQAAHNPVSPDMKTILVLIIVLGLPFVLVLVLAHDIITRGIRSADDLAEASGVQASQVLTVRAAQRDARRTHDAPARAFSPHGDSMRLLEARVMRSVGSGAGARIVAVCSPDGSGPKTMTALGLARMMAGNGQRVLLIDANGEAGVLARHADLPPASRIGGFAQDLGQMTLLLQRDPLSSVSLLLNVVEEAGPGWENAARAFPNILRAARSSFDVVIIDMPHGRRMGTVAGGMVRVDAIVLVALWGGTGRDAVRETLALIGDMREGATLLPVLAGQPDNGLGYGARLSGELT